MVKNMFRTVGMAGLAVGMMASAAVAEPQSPQAQNVSLNNTTVAAATALPVAERDCRSKSMVFCKAGAEKVSANRLTILVYDGEDRLYSEVFDGAARLTEEGIPVAIIRGPDIDQDQSSLGFRIYAQGASHAEGLSFSENLGGAEKLSDGIYDLGKEVDQRTFKLL